MMHIIVEMTPSSMQLYSFLLPSPCKLFRHPYRHVFLIPHFSLGILIIFLKNKSRYNKKQIIYEFLEQIIEKHV